MAFIFQAKLKVVPCLKNETEHYSVNLPRYFVAHWDSLEIALGFLVIILGFLRDYIWIL